MPKKRSPKDFAIPTLLHLMVRGKLEAHYDIRRLTGSGQRKIKGKTDPDYGDEN